ncbi:hypothetical protein PINS_up013815 [Pythium insidiosum]|nr:hypothetical protein PINS_up013815 [Pythium insidiosum]
MKAEDFMRAFPVQEFIPVSLDDDNNNQRVQDVVAEPDHQATHDIDQPYEPIDRDPVASTTPEDDGGDVTAVEPQSTQADKRRQDTVESSHDQVPSMSEADRGMPGLSAIASAVLGLSSLESGLFSKKKSKPTLPTGSTSKAKTLSKAASSSKSLDNAPEVSTELATFHQEPRTIAYSSSSATAIQIRSDGSAIAKWPNGSVAVSIDRERDGFRAYAAHKDGQVALSLDADGVGFINYYPSGRMLLSTSSSGDGLLFSADGATIIRQWDAALNIRDERWETTDRLGDEPDGALLVKLSDALAVRLRLVDRQESRRPSALQLEVFFSSNGVRYVLNNWLNLSSPADCADACAAVFGPLSVGKSSKKQAELPPRSHQATLQDIRAAVAKLDGVT